MIAHTVIAHRKVEYFFKLNVKKYLLKEFSNRKEDNMSRELPKYECRRKSMHLSTAEGKHVILSPFPISLSRNFFGNSEIQKIWNVNYYEYPTNPNLFYHLSLWSFIFPGLFSVCCISITNTQENQLIRRSVSVGSMFLEFWLMMDWPWDSEICMCVRVRLEEHRKSVSYLMVKKNNQKEERKGVELTLCFIPTNALWGTSLTRPHFVKVPSYLIAHGGKWNTFIQWSWK